MAIKIARKHFLTIDGVGSDVEPPKRVTWNMFRFGVQNDTNKIHLDDLERAMEESGAFDGNVLAAVPTKDINIINRLVDHIKSMEL